MRKPFSTPVCHSTEGFTPPSKTEIFPKDTSNLMAGFTLIEIVLVVAIFTALFVFATGIGYNFYIHYVLTSERDNVVNLLRSARSSAMANYNQSSQGIYMSTSTGQYVFFQGDSYAARNQEQDAFFPLSPSVIVSGPTEIVFNALDGSANVSGTVAIGNSVGSVSARVNYEGGIDW